MTDVFNDVKASLLKYCKDVIDRNNLQGFVNFDFDAHATIHQWPDKDLVGVGEYSITNEDKHYHVTCLIAVSTRANDSQLQKLSNVIGCIFKELEPGFGGIQVVDSKTGQLRGNLVVMDDVSVLPVARADTRPIQMIAVRLGSSFLVPP